MLLEILVSHLINHFCMNNSTCVVVILASPFLPSRSSVNFLDPVGGTLGLIHSFKKSNLALGLSVENPSCVSIILILKCPHPPSAPHPLWLAGPGSFVTQTSSHMRAGLTSVHQERQMTQSTAPFHNRMPVCQTTLEERDE